MKPRRRPNLLVIGAAKAGTTSLWAEFRQQASVFVPVNKEPGLLPQLDEKQNSRSLIHSYLRNFDAATDEPYVADLSTNLTYYPLIDFNRRNVVRWLDDPKVVMMTRQPVDRLMSAFRHEASIGRVSPDLGLAVKEYPTLVDVSRYGFQLEQWAPHIQSGNLFVGSLEEYTRDRSGFLSRLGSFLGIQFDPTLPEPHLNQSARGVRGKVLRKIAGGQRYRRSVAPRIPVFFKEAVKNAYNYPELLGAASSWDGLDDTLRNEILCSFADDRTEMMRRWSYDPETGRIS